jgi:hypothetical protein
MVVGFNKLTILLFIGIIITFFETVRLRLQINNHMFVNALRNLHVILFFRKTSSELNRKFTLKILLILFKIDKGYHYQIIN